MSVALGHGGNLDAAAALFGEPVEGWVDLSTGINPIGYPVFDVSSELWQHLPTKADCDAAITAARARYGVPNSAGIMVAPGTQAILQWLPHLFEKSTIAVVSPTYGEHAYTWSEMGHDVIAVSTLASAVDDPSVRIAVICNPNNPDGRMASPEEISTSAAVLSARDGLLIVDEAFCDVTPAISVVSETGMQGLLVLRSLGKMYGLAGARVGFAVAHHDLSEKLAEAMGPWSVSGPALRIATTALCDSDWLDQARERLRQSRFRLDHALNAANLRIKGGTDLFRLVESPDSDKLFRFLGESGIWVRKFIDQPEWLRFGIPGTTTEWQRLEKAFHLWFRHEAES